MQSKMDHMLRIVAETFGVSVDEITSQRRTRRILPARHVAAYLAHTALEMWPRDVGNRFGGRDYTNILMYCRAVARRAQDDDEFRLLVQELAVRIR